MILEKNQPAKRGREDESLIVPGKQIKLHLDEEDLFNYCFEGASNNINLKESRMLITVTTNKTIDGAFENINQYEYFKNDLESVVKRFVNDEANWVAKIKVPTFGNVNVQFVNLKAQSALQSVVDKIEVNEFAWEEGPKFKRVHFHMMATLEYSNFNGYFHIDRQSLWNEIRGRMNYMTWYGRTPYINIRFIKNPVVSVMKYIKKLHNQNHYESLAKRTLDKINEYKIENNPNPEL